MTYSDKTTTKSGKHKFEFIATSLCLDFCNTTNLAVPEPNERIRTHEDLVLYGKMAGILSSTKAVVLYDSSLRYAATADQTVRAALYLRASLHRLFVDVARKVRPVFTDIDMLNEALELSLSRQRILFDRAGFGLGWEQTTHLDCMV